jgi:GNAT superfamily N-acetyltransferase
VVALAAGGALLRLKNMLVHPSWRGMGVATAVLHCARLIAWREGWSALGAFVVSGDPGEQVYTRAGYQAVARQTEWMRPLGFRVERLEAT